MSSLINNPINIHYSENNNWLGQEGVNSLGYVCFRSIFDGIRSAILLLKNYYFMHSLNTVEAIITRYAPSTGKNAKDYIKFVCEQTKFSHDEKLSPNDVLYKVLPAMALYETTTTLEEDSILYNETHSYIV